MVLFYFGQGQGGSVSDNMARWQSQFSSADGSPVTPVVEVLVVDGMPLTVAEFSGSYARSMGIGQSGHALLGQALVAATMETPRGNVYVQLHGPAGTVAARAIRLSSTASALRNDVSRAGNLAPT